MILRRCKRFFGLLMVCAITGVFLYAYFDEVPLPLEQDPVEFSFVSISDIQNVDPTQAINPIPSLVSWQEDLGGRNVCSEGKPFIIAVVMSALEHSDRRKWIRSTWANPRYFNSTRIRAVFLLGATTNATLQELVEKESNRHHDIIQNNFIDSYRNLTYKSISMLSWVDRHCPDVPWLAKIDDDMVVNPWHLTQYLLKQIKYDPSPEKIYGRLRMQAKPWREGKWSVTEEEFPGELYPPIVLGPAYVIGRIGVTKLLQHVPETPFFWLEDVFTTGLTAERAGVSHVSTDLRLYIKKLSRTLYAGEVAFFIGATDKLRDAAWKGILRYSDKNKKW